MNKYLICILSVLFWSGCSKPTKQDSLDKILYQYEKNDKLKDLIKGNWKGCYEILSPTYDTTFYKSHEEKLEFILSNEISDSSLIKELVIKDTFQTAPIEIDFNIDEGKTKFLLGTPDTTYSIDFRLSYYQESRIQFGFDTLTNIEDSTQLVVGFPLSNHGSLQQALLSKSFELIIKTHSKDSMTLGLDQGYGEIKLKKVD